MSLQVWLPLNGNLNNQGLSNITVTNNGATVDNNGKIGKCYSFADNKYISTNYTWASSNTFSIFTWIKKDSKNGIGTLFRTTTKYSPIIDFNGTDGALRIFYWYDSSNYYMMTYPALEANIWYHVGITYDGATFCFYINGEVVQTMTASSAPYITGTFNIGKSHETNFFKGKMNDFRIYDHALSIKEIKELSKGLVLHYRLAGPGGTNLLPGTHVNENKITYPESNYSDRNIASIKTDVLNGTTYTVSFEAKSTHSGDKIRIHFYNPSNITKGIGSQGQNNTASDGNMDFTLSDKWEKYWATYTIPANGNATRSVIIARVGASNSSFPTGTGTLSFRHEKVEEGSIATPWCPNPADALYSAMGYNNNIEYDCSGYRYNGAKSGNIAWDVNSPRYTTSYKFIPSNRITSTTGMPIGLNTVFTVNFWLYIPSGKTFAQWGDFIGFNGSDIRLETSNTDASHLNWYNYPVGSSGGLTGFNLTKDTWNMITLICDGSKFIQYLNGNLLANTNLLGTAFSTNGSIWIGDTQNMYFNISDLRIYATALSTDDVKELYETSASVSKGNIVSAYEFVE